MRPDRRARHARPRRDLGVLQPGWARARTVTGTPGTLKPHGSSPTERSFRTVRRPARTSNYGCAMRVCPSMNSATTGPALFIGERGRPYPVPRERHRDLVTDRREIWRRPPPAADQPSPVHNRPIRGGEVGDVAFPARSRASASSSRLMLFAGPGEHGREVPEEVGRGGHPGTACSIYQDVSPRG